MTQKISAAACFHTAAPCRYLPALGGRTFKSAAASAAVVVAAATAAAFVLRTAAHTVVAAAAEQENENDDPAAAVAVRVKTAHNISSLWKVGEIFAPLRSFRFTVHNMPWRKIGYRVLWENAL